MSTVTQDDLQLLPAPIPGRDKWGAALTLLLSKIIDGKADVAAGMLRTTGKPSDAVGVDGNLAIDRTSKLIYAKSGGTWDAGTSLKGDAGPQGAQGSSGSQGPQGSTGAQGPQGPAGPQGPQGSQGPAGTSDIVFKGAYDPAVTYAVKDSIAYNGQQYFSKVAGNAGHTPPAGTAGDSFWGVLAGAGPQGATGPAGAPGAAGAQGPQGPSGAAGATGPQGPQGPAGATGAAGAQGPAGATGTAGTSAYQAWLNAGNTGDQAAFLASLKGAKGDTGAAGPQGTAGAAGATGPQGSQGPAGAAGAAGAQGPQGPAGAAGAVGPAGATGAAGADGAGIYRAPNAGKTDFVAGTSTLYVGAKADLDATFTAKGSAPAATDLVRYTDPIRFADGIRATPIPKSEAVTSASYTLATGRLHGCIADVRADGPIDSLWTRNSNAAAITGVSFAQAYVWNRKGVLLAVTDPTATANALMGATGTIELPLTTLAQVNVVDGCRFGILAIFTGTAPKIIASGGFSSWAGLGAKTTGTSPVLSPTGHYFDLPGQTGTVGNIDPATLQAQAAAGMFELLGTDANRGTV